jgi:hypothetical protein
VARRTVSLLPGSLTVAYCSSLYFLNAGSSAEASLLASALMSSWRLDTDREHDKVATHTGHDIGKLRRSALHLSSPKGFSYRPLPGAPIRRTMLLWLVWKPLFRDQRPHRVTVQSASVVVQQSCGSAVKARCRCANAKHVIRPGEFINICLTYSQLPRCPMYLLTSYRGLSYSNVCSNEHMQ